MANVEVVVNFKVIYTGSDGNRIIEFEDRDFSILEAAHGKLRDAGLGTFNCEKIDRMSNPAIFSSDNKVRVSVSTNDGQKEDFDNVVSGTIRRRNELEHGSKKTPYEIRQGWEDYMDVKIRALIEDRRRLHELLESHV